MVNTRLSVFQQTNCYLGDTSASKECEAQYIIPKVHVLTYVSLSCNNYVLTSFVQCFLEVLRSIHVVCKLRVGEHLSLLYPSPCEPLVANVVVVLLSQPLDELSSTIVK